MTERAAYWRRVLRDWEQSGLSQAKFCRRRGLAAVTFAWWKRRLRQLDESRGASHQAGFVELALPGRQMPSGGFAYELALPGGACLRITADFDPERVARLLQILAAAC